jgi:hypothetical protein
MDPYTHCPVCNIPLIWSSVEWSSVDEPRHKVNYCPGKNKSNNINFSHFRQSEDECPYLFFQCISSYTLDSEISLLSNPLVNSTEIQGMDIFESGKQIVIPTFVDAQNLKYYKDNINKILMLV